MKVFITVKNFKELVEKGQGRSTWKYYGVGQDFESDNAERIKELLDEGLIVDKAHSLDAQASALALQAEKKLAEVDALRKRADALKQASAKHEEKA